MEDFIHLALGWLLRAVVFIALEMLFLQVFYYIGALPVWVLTAGRLPTKDPMELSRRNRILYASIGLVATVLLVFWWAATSTGE